MRTALIATLALLMSPAAFASLLNLENGSRTLEGVVLADSASTTVEGQAVALRPLGAGLRQKRVLLMDVKVYVAQLLADTTDKFVRKPDGALASMETVKTSAIHLTFLRTVEAEKVQASFKEALMANEINVNAPDIKQFLRAVQTGGEATEGTSLTLLFERRSNGQEAVRYEDSKGQVSEVLGAKGFVTSLLAIWLGEPADDGLDALKKQLLSGN